ncbi:molybdenum cofactor biosynthesis protein MoaE [Actinomyces sp.]|uniref:molybdenum cofactor biosynthesis protein MoaE n=1 Tax=Actinomyces sp. TaxID=29317 RepID=UPI0026DB4FAA|nr:molybdenum cofactor biosynthesis protein MoaE [Actinomyces sp.]
MDNGVGARVARAEVTAAPLSTDSLASGVADPAAGALVTFDGRVRDHDGGRQVTAITYTAHPSATGVLVEIAQEVAERPGIRALGVAHRVGDLEVGETALAVAVSADHRQDAFAALAEIVEEVKRRLPMWKCQHLVDGSREWANLG